MKIVLDNPTLVYSPPVNSETSKWGVYAIPKMWKNHTGELVIRFNGEQDCGLTPTRVPHLFFVSEDNGDSWKLLENGESAYDLSYFSGINPPFTKLKNGDLVGLRYKPNAKAIDANMPYIKEFTDANKSVILHIYKYGDIPKQCKGAEFFRKSGDNISLTEINFDFPEREILVISKGYDEDKKEYIPVPELVQSNVFWTPYFTGITELEDGTLVAVTHGQNPEVSDRICETAYLVASTDNGLTWEKRGIIASDASRKYGCCGDGGEISITQSSNGNLICAMRTDMSIEDCTCDTLISISSDNGYTWSEPKSVADSSVTPHVVALKDGIVLLIYGRPGVHFKISEDNGLSWSSSYSIIGKTLSEELASGNKYMDAKYYDTCSYSNTFIEKLSDDTVLVLYNNLKYDDGDGKNHKAAFVRKITVTK